MTLARTSQHPPISNKLLVMTGLNSDFRPEKNDYYCALYLQEENWL